MSVSKFELKALAATGSSGQGGGVSVSGIDELLVSVVVTATTGTTPLLSVFLQSTDDGGTTWYDLPYDLALITADTTHTEGDHRSPNAAAASGSAKIGARNILDNENTVRRAIAKYTNFGEQVRAAWVISGTSPSFTFEVNAQGKT